MRTAGVIGGSVLALAGAVWILQGFDVALAPESFMTDNRQWAFIGGSAVAAGLVLAAWSWRRRR